MMDETPVQVLKEDDRRAQTKSYFWVIRTGEDGLDPIILYNYTPTRAGENARRFLNGIARILSDGRRISALQQSAGKPLLLGTYPQISLESIPKGMDKDYTNPAVRDFSTVKNCSHMNGTIEKKDLVISKYTHAASKTKNLLLRAFGVAETGGSGSNGKLKKAITYIRNREEFLMTYLEDGRCSFSNNLSENSIRPVTVGRELAIL